MRDIDTDDDLEQLKKDRDCMCVRSALQPAQPELLLHRITNRQVSILTVVRSSPMISPPSAPGHGKTVGRPSMQVSDRPRHSRKSERGGRDGSDVSEHSSYRIIMVAGRPVLALPALSRRSELWGLSRYQPVTRKKYWFRTILTLALYLHLDRFLGPRRTSPFPPEEDFGFEQWLLRARAALAAPEALATIIWTPRADRKRVYVHLMDRRGKAIAFCKIAVDEPSRASLSREIAALTTLRDLELATLKIPRLLHHEACAGYCYAAFEPMSPSAKVTRLPWSALAPAATQLSGQIRVIDQAGLARQKWWQRFNAQRASFELAFLKAIDRAVGRGIAVCRAHGDFVVQNVYVDGSTSWLCDWEFSSDAAPRRSDEIAYYLSSHFARCIAHPREALGEIFRQLDWQAYPERVGEVAMALAFLASGAGGCAEFVAAHWYLPEP